ncbi:MAG: transglutaminase domain-containing protein [Actinomycetaceae bacterium]|nr:transglutaminase domain-containing protein [Actinomycetaceae bacterium]
MARQREKKKIPPRKITLDRSALLGLFSIVALAMLVTLASWPIYVKYTVGITGLSASFFGVLLGIIVVKYRLRVLGTTITTILLYLIGAFVGTMTWMLYALPASLLQGARLVFTGPIFSWKNLLTIPLPAGDFEDAQIPLFLVLYGATSIATYFLLHPKRQWFMGLIPLTFALFFPTLFGSAVEEEPLIIGSFVFSSPFHQFAGLASFAVLLGWPILRTRRERAERIKAGRQTGTNLPTGKEKRKAFRQHFTALLMVMTAVFLALIIAIPLTNMRDRSVPRSAVEVEHEVPEVTSPISAYRSFFTSENLNTVLLRVDGEAPSRLRFAALGYYDGTAFKAYQDTKDMVDNVSTQTVDPLNSTYARVPYQIMNTTGKEHELTITIESYESPWIPLTDQLKRIDFSGASQLDLSHGFYFNQEAQSAFENFQRDGSSALRQDDSYTLTYTDHNIIGEDSSDVSSRRAPENAIITPPNEDDMPNLHKWIKAQETGGGSVGEVIRLRDALMERSYLGRSKMEPEGDTTWMPKDYTFRGSDAGSSIGRIDGLFSAMLDGKYRSCDDTTGVGKCAAHVGDEEQYATATALIARVLGFPSRVVFGANINETGEIKGSDTIIWVEIQDATGTWISLDVDPRIDNDFVEQPDKDSYRKYNPAISQENAVPMDPPDKDPTNAGEEETRDREETSFSKIMVYLVMVAKIGGVILLVTSPLWGVLLAKFIRRTRRKRKGDPNQKVIAGWREYVDTIRDSGVAVMRYQTRNEIAEEANDHVTSLAQKANYAAFSGQDVSSEYAQEYWREVIEEQKSHVRTQKFLGRLRTRISIRSFLHYRKKK